VCIAEGFPGLPFFVNEDLTRADGVIQCRQMSTAEAIRYGWRMVRALRYLLELPIEF
jgi:hypothetical protein